MKKICRNIVMLLCVCLAVIFGLGSGAVQTAKADDGDSETWKKKWRYSAIERWECGECAATLDWENMTLTISHQGEKQDGIVPSSLASQDFFVNNEFKSITIKDGITKLDDSCFCEGKFENIVFEGKSVEIGKGSFAGVKKLKTITIPDGTTKIGEAAFYHCEDLTSVTLPLELSVIPQSCFEGCSNLGTDASKEAVVIKGKTYSIGMYAFTGCDQLDEIYLPRSIQSIGANAFDDDITIYYPGTKDEIEKMILVDGDTLRNRIISSADEKPANPDVKVEVTTEGVKVSWETVTNATKYEVWYYDTTQSGWRKYKECEAYVTDCTLDKLTSGQYYGFCVRAKSASGLRSDIVNHKLVYLDSVKPTLSNSMKGVTLEWKKVGGAQGYRVWRRTPNSGWELLMEDCKDTKYEDNSAKSGTQYYYAVRAFTKSPSGSASFKTSAPTVYLAPTSIKVENNSNNNATVTWNKVQGAAGYKVYRNEAGKGWNVISTIENSSATKYVDDYNRKDGISYYYAVRPYYEVDGKTYYANFKSVSIRCLAKPSFKLTSESGVVNISWDGVAGAENYLIYRYDGSKWHVIDTVSSATMTYVDESVSGMKGQRVNYMVRAYSKDGISDYQSGNSLSVTIN